MADGARKNRRLRDTWFWPSYGGMEGSRRRGSSPMTALGTIGTAIYGGFVQDDEKSGELSSRERRYQTYSDILANTSIVAAGVRYFLNLVAKATWRFEPSETDTDGMYAELVEEMLMEDPRTPWHRVVRRAAMYRFYGFSIQEWTARRREDGVLTYDDISPRAQSTIARWDVDLHTGRVMGAVQWAPQSYEEIYLPREKIVYLVDDSLNDSPEGMGIFRHLVAPARRLRLYEKLEGYGFETDLRGIPVGRGPFTELARMVAEGELTEEDRRKIEQPLRTFIENHIKNPNLGILLDSLPYASADESGQPSNLRQWEVELLTGSPTGFEQNAAAIERLNREIARIIGVEHMLLGSDSTGSYALSQDKTASLYLTVDGALKEIREAFDEDLIRPLFRLNGWDEEMRPMCMIESVKFHDVDMVAAALRDMATAGAPLTPDDPAVGEVRDMMSLSPPDPDKIAEQMRMEEELRRKAMEGMGEMGGGGNADEGGGMNGGGGMNDG